MFLVQVVILLQIMTGVGNSSGPGYMFGVGVILLQIMLGASGSSGPGYRFGVRVILLQVMFGVVVVLLEITCLLLW